MSALTRREALQRAGAGGLGALVAAAIPFATHAPPAYAADVSLTDATLQAFADTILPGRKATRTDLGNASTRSRSPASTRRPARSRRTRSRCFTTRRSASTHSHRVPGGARGPVVARTAATSWASASTPAWRRASAGLTTTTRPGSCGRRRRPSRSRHSAPRRSSVDATAATGVRIPRDGAAGHRADTATRDFSYGRQLSTRDRTGTGSLP